MSARTLRGGSWFHHTWRCRSAGRNALEPDSRFDSLGFRLAVGSQGLYRVLRGGSWGYSYRGCRSARRITLPPADRFGFIGLRLVCGGGNDR